MQELFRIYDKDKKGYITLDDFLSFYENASWYHEETVWGNLRGLGYGYDLVRFDLKKREKPEYTTNYQNLPRFILSNDGKNFGFLIALLGIGEEVADAVWHLMFNLAPSERHFTKLLNLFKDKDNIKYEEVFSEKQPFESIIYLYLAETIISDTAPQDILEIRNEPHDEQRTSWKLNFIQYNGLEWIVNVFLFEIT